MFGIKELKRQIIESRERYQQDLSEIHSMMYEILEEVRYKRKELKIDEEKLDDLLSRTAHMMNEFKGAIAMSRASLKESKNS